MLSFKAPEDFGVFFWVYSILLDARLFVLRFVSSLVIGSQEL